MNIILYSHYSTHLVHTFILCYRQDIGEQRAYEKACQALREGAPDVRRQLAAKEVAAAALALDGMGWYSSEARDETSGRDGFGGGDNDVERE